MYVESCERAGVRLHEADLSRCAFVQDGGKFRNAFYGFGLRGLPFYGEITECIRIWQCKVALPSFDLAGVAGKWTNRCVYREHAIARKEGTA